MLYMTIVVRLDGIDRLIRQALFKLRERERLERNNFNKYREDEKFAGLNIMGERFNIMGGSSRARVALSCVIQERYEDRGGDKVDSGTGNRRVSAN